MNQLTSSRFLIICLILGNVFADYYRDRENILEKEASQLIGSSIDLKDKEKLVNKILMNIKLQEYDEGIENPGKFLASKHFFHSKCEIEKSELFKIIKIMPKGASLHTHSSAMLSFEALYNMTYFPNLYGCDVDGSFRIQFFVGKIDNTCEWKLLSELRDGNPKFDNFIRDKMSLVVDDPETSYADINAVWKKFEQIFKFLRPLLSYRPFLHDYLYKVFQEYHDDNVMYLEIRGGWGQTYDSTGVVHDANDTPQFYLDVLNEFQEANPEFVGLRMIYAIFRRTNVEKMAQYIKRLLHLQERYPQIIAGFDLVGQEDAGNPLGTYIDLLSSIRNKTKFFFHAGETNWNGVPSDLNLIDAVLLNAIRIGHGFALPKHPEVLRIIKDRQIGIELNPISNQVLKLVDDLRNHPGSSWIAGGYPVVVTCDDPTLWGAKGLSYDWYLTFMAMVPRTGDLRVLKQLAINSLMYAAIDPVDKPFYLSLFEDRWEIFLDKVLEKYHY